MLTADASSPTRDCELGFLACWGPERADGASWRAGDSASGVLGLLRALLRPPCAAISPRRRCAAATPRLAGLCPLPLLGTSGEASSSNVVGSWLALVVRGELEAAEVLDAVLKDTARDRRLLDLMPAL